MSSSDLLHDKRILDRNLTKGLITKKDLEKHLAALVDSSRNAEFLDPEAALAEELGPKAEEPAETASSHAPDDATTSSNEG